MSNLPTELIDRMRKSVEEREMIKNLLVPLGFTLYTKAVFYGASPFNIYCGKIEDYQSLIDNVDSIKEEYLEHKKRALGFSTSLFN